MSADRCFQEQIGRLTLLALEVGGLDWSVSGGLVEDGPGPSWTLARGWNPYGARCAFGDRSGRCAAVLVSSGGRDRRVAKGSG